MDIINSTEPIARKTHKCDWCGLPIKKGEKYESQVLKDETIYNWRNHIRCSDIAYKLDMFYHCDEGLSGDAFQESISEEYVSIKDIEFEDLPPFDIQLDAVCSEYLD